MPPVRWKLWFYAMAILVEARFVADAQQMHDSISMSSDGWRPIVGSRRQPVNQNQELEVVQADVFNIETTTVPLSQSSLSVPKVAIKNSAFYSKASKQGITLKQFKATNPYYTITQGSHGSQIPISASQQLKKPQGMKKATMIYSKPRKPVRGQAVAYSHRNEIFVPPPPSNTGSYSIVKSISPNNVKTREAQGFGLIGSSNFGINQPNAHVELTRFPLTGGEGILQRPTYFFANPQTDEFTRNLAPPPQGRLRQQNKERNHKISLYAFKEGPIADATSSFSQIGVKANQFVPQVSPTFDFSTQPQQQQKSQQKGKEQVVDVQVTKENVKQLTQTGPESFVNAPGTFPQNTPGTFTHLVPTFGSIPATRNHFPIEYVDYDFHPPRPSSLPNTLTYEVTEGKWLDTPSQQYRLRQQDTFVPKRTQQLQNNARPGLLFQPDVSSSRPPFFQAPLVDLNVPAFLPTPYRPEGTVLPTSPTQREVSTVFNRVSTKKNRLRNNALRNNPQLFDITDVSTHYPILGTPEAQSEGSTDISLPLNEKGEISNEITAQQEIKKGRIRRPTKEPTRPTSTRDPTRSRITNRRRPRPNKPSTITTDETFIEPIRLQEAVEETPTETEPPSSERPQRRRRPKPTYRPKPEEEKDKTSVEDDTSNKQRGRYRFRSRERPSTERIDTGNVVRKRIRPTYSNNIVKNQQKQFYDENAESSSMEHEQYSYENYPSVESSYSEEISPVQPSGPTREISTQSQLPDKFLESAQEEPIRQDNRPFIEEINPTTEKFVVHEITHIPSTSTTEAESSTLFHVPENEIDYTTQAAPKDEIIATTPETTTSSTEITTIKSNRIRRPSKYDASNRPRFSVKDYRQRLNQYSSSTPSTSTHTQQRNSEDTPRLRFPNRLRTRPSPTPASSRVDEDATDETTTVRSRFLPKEPRYHATTENNIITEKSVAAVNTRLRPFGRSKVTTEATTTAAKVAIRPNLFSARRRTGYPSLKTRIQNKYKKNITEEVDETETTTAPANELQEIESLKITETISTESTSTTTDFELNQITSEESSSEFNDQTTTEDIMKSDTLLYSQRVSDLTSSFKDYDKPGIFNSVAPTSRSIPNYFTISTDDPILPIEAFFPSLKDKGKER